jgi:DmsE family decaheme c-type cytochrome
LVLAFIVAVVVCSAAQSAGDEEGFTIETAQVTYPAPTNLTVLPKDMTGQQVHDMMDRWVSDLGVRCSACHAEDQEHLASTEPSRSRFADDSKPMKEIARRMYAMTEKINDGFIAMMGNSGLPVSCGTCHRGRITPESSPLLAIAEPPGGQPGKTSKNESCFQCHEDERTAFAMPSRHKVEEGLISCADCHEPHDAGGQKLQRTPAQEDLICTKCHTETAGPFVYEHAVVKTEGCLACHVPHGGPNPHMLNREEIDTTCRLCHLPSRSSPTGMPVKEAHDLESQPQPCTACHADIHGSDISPAFLIKK